MRLSALCGVAASFRQGLPSYRQPYSHWTLEVNYVELHLGDYDKKTAHLTACEDGIYGRLLRRYYDTESPLPLEIKAVQRLVRARSPEELEAVCTILHEFFTAADDGWRNSRCDEEIAKYRAKREKAQNSANARWARSERNANAMRTHSEGNAHQSPDTSHQSTPGRFQQAVAIPRPGTPAGLACKAMRQAGCMRVNPSNPNLLAALDEGVTAEALADTVREGVEAGRGDPFAWAIATARGRHREGARPIGGNARAGPSSGKTMQGLQLLEDMKRGLVSARSDDGFSEVALLGVGAAAGG